MSTAHDTHAGEHEGGHAHPIDPLWLYLVVFGGLLFMTVITVGASYVDFGAANTVIAVIIATIKASLVAIFFMQLRHDKPFHALVLVSGLVFLSFLFLFTLSDEGTRNDVDEFNGQVIVKKPEAPAVVPGAASGAAHGSAPTTPAAPAHH
jgi:cytochrome c oxidase subunit 4